MIDDAEAQARRYLSEAQVEADQVVAERLASIASLTDSLAVEAEEIRSRSERLLVSLEEAKAQLSVNGQGAPVQAAERTGGAAAGVGSRGSHLTAVTAGRGAAGGGDADRPRAAVDRAGHPRRGATARHPDGGLRQQPGGDRRQA